MNHAITIGGLLLGLCILVGLVMAAIGALATFAGGMSDAPSEGDKVSGQGCVVFIVGVAIAAGSLWGMLS